MKRIILFITIWIGVCFPGIGQILKNMTAKQVDLQVAKVGEYDKISLNETFYMTDVIGQPELPVYIQSFVVPLDAQISEVKINRLSKQKLEGTYYVYPVQPPRPVSFKDSINDFSLPDPAIYNSSMPYPGKQAEIISDDVYLGYRIVTVQLYPVEYNPKSKELYVCNFDYSIDYSMKTKQSGSNEFVTKTQSLHRYELNKRNVKFFVENPESVDGYDTKVQKVVQGKTIVYNFSTISNEKAVLRSQAVSVLNEQTPDYIIITNNALKPSFQTLADWKTKKGIFTIVVTTEEISSNYSGSDLQEKIRNYLLDANSKWGTGLYILLGGDINIIPSRLIRGISNSTLSYPSDRYYSTSDSWGIYPGSNISPGTSSTSIINFLGRIPVSNAQEVTTYTNKLIVYEKANGLGDLNYLKNNLYADAYLEVRDNGNLYNFFHKNIKDYRTTYIPSHINNKYICDNANCSGSTTRYGTSGSDCSNGNTNGNIELNSDNFLSCLNSGAGLGVGKFHFIYHLEHSGAHSMATSGRDKGQSINRTDMDNLMNGPSYQILLSSGCHPADFQYDCMGKHYLMNPNGGGVAFIGNTDVGWQEEYYQVSHFLNAIYSTTGHSSLGRYDIGSAYQNVCKNNSRTDRWRLHLLGDPEMQIWTNVPQILNVTGLPTSIQARSGALTITVSGLNLPSGETALICVQKGTEVYETKRVSTNGTYTIPFTAETTGTMNVTVTAHNYFPVEKTVQVTSSTVPNPVIQTVNFVDNGTNSSIGNSNGQNDAGETIRLEVVLKNNGNSMANNLTATLSSTSSHISVLNSSSTIGNVAANGTAVAQFLYKIDKDAPEILSNAINPVQFKLDIKDASNTEWTRIFNIDVFEDILQQRNKVNISTTNSVVTFNIELQNIGQAPATGLTATLKANNVVMGSRSYPTIEQFETKTASSAFQFTIPSGYTATNTPLKLEVTNAYGKMWAFNFNLTKPGNISGLKSISGERNITLMWNVVTDVSDYNIYRCNVGANDMESGSYIKLNTTPTTSAFFDDSNNLGILTKYYYKVVAVSSSGMESDAVRILAWTSFPSKGLFPVQMGISEVRRALSSVNTSDVNNDGYQEIFTSVSTGSSGLGYLVGLDYDGVELFDIDNNVTTYSGFAGFDASIWAQVGIGDLYATGEEQIVSVTREIHNPSVNTITCYAVKDTNGDHLPDMLWQKQTTSSYVKGAVIANVDNSSDGSMEIILKADAESAGRPGGNKIQVLDNMGNLLYSFGNSGSYSATAVSDLDGDGDKEIIAGYSDGVYIWHHNGMSYSDSVRIFKRTGYYFRSSPVICDLYGNGEKVILIVASKVINPQENPATQGVIYALKPDGTVLQGWGTSTQTFPIASQNLSQEISVGDLNNDGYLEVVSIGSNVVNVWDRFGNAVSSTPLQGVSGTSVTPILADVDGGSDVEILAVSITEGRIYGLKWNGTSVLGFPLRTDEKFDAVSPCVVDVDNNGKSEVIAMSGNKIYMWETNGNPNRIEWGSERHDPQNTGEYYKCSTTVIQSNTVWNSNQEACNDIIVESGTLTLNATCTLTMKEPAMIVVHQGANLIINGGKILNADVKALPGSSVTLKNDGYVKLRREGRFNINLGATFSHQRGKIDITQ